MPYPTDPTRTEQDAPAPLKDKRNASRRRSKRKNGLEAPQMNPETLQKVLDATPCMSVILASDGTILYFSRFAELLTGYAAAEVVGKDYPEVFISDARMRKSARQELKKSFAARSTSTEGFEQPLWDKDGVRHWILWHGQLLADFRQFLR